jgi:hypothetical protein
MQKNALEWQYWIKKNQHKFVFYGYRGGAGGEYVCNHISQNDYFFNSKIENYDNRDNTSLFEDELMLGFFFDMCYEKNPNFGTIEKLTSALVKYWGLNPCHYQDIFETQDKPYLMCIHHVWDWIPKLFPDAKIIVQVPEDWVYYIKLLGEYKIKKFRNMLEIGERTGNYIKLIKENYPEYNYKKLKLYSFEDMFTGEWIEKEFGFSGESFSLAYHEWDKKNIEYLNKLGITDIKRPKINLPRYVQTT